MVFDVKFEVLIPAEGDGVGIGDGDGDFAAGVGFDTGALVDEADAHENPEVGDDGGDGIGGDAGEDVGVVGWVVAHDCAFDDEVAVFEGAVAVVEVLEDGPAGCEERAADGAWDDGGGGGGVGRDGWEGIGGRNAGLEEGGEVDAGSAVEGV